MPEFALHPLGQVVGGSLSAGLDIKLDARTMMEGLAVGRYVVVTGQQTGRKFFGLVTDIGLDATNPDLAKMPPEAGDDFARQAYAGQIAFGTMHVAPMLVLDPDANEPKPVKTIPAHFSPVFEATEDDVNKVFGKEDAQHFHIGSPLDMETVKVNLDLQRFVERSSGVFGKSGTGKSFITRTILAGVIKAGAAVNLIFDMHNDYGWSVLDEHGREYKGLRQIFGDGRVQVITLDPETSQHRKSKVDGTLQIPLGDIDPEDVEMLAGIVGLTEVQVGALYYLRRRLGKDWIARMLDEHDTSAVDEIEEEEKVQKGTLRAMQRKFELFRRLKFLTPRPPADDMVEYIFHALNRGTNIVLEFGVYGNSLAAYVFVAKDRKSVV